MTRTTSSLGINLSVSLLILVAFTITSCDFGAKRDLKRAERVLRKADELNAERWAEKEYRKAQKAFDEAVDLERERKINEARDKAVICIDWAEEACMWAKIRAEEMQKEQDALGVYKE